MNEEITVLYATGNGNSRRLAEKLESSILETAGKACLFNLRDCGAQKLIKTNFAVFLISTWGEGDPPPDAESFFASIAGCEDSLRHLRYCMVGLGDSCFVNFCGASMTLDHHLQRLGAERVMPVRKLDVCFMPEFRKWENDFLLLLESNTTSLHQAEAVSFQTNR